MCVCVCVCVCVSVCVCVCVCTYICIYVCYTGAEESNSRLYVGLWQPSGNEPANQPMVVRGGGGSDGSFRLSSSGALLHRGQAPLLHRGQAHDLSLPHTNIHIDPPSASAEPGAFLRAAFDSSPSLDDAWELGDTEMDGGRERYTRTYVNVPLRPLLHGKS